VANAAWLFTYGYPTLAMAASVVTSSAGVPANAWNTAKGLIMPPEDAKLGAAGGRGRGWVHPKGLRRSGSSNRHYGWWAWWASAPGS
jgi:hypothetical protein